MVQNMCCAMQSARYVAFYVTAFSRHVVQLARGTGVPGPRGVTSGKVLKQNRRRYGSSLTQRHPYSATSQLQEL